MRVPTTNVISEINRVLSDCDLPPGSVAALLDQLAAIDDPMFGGIMRRVRAQRKSRERASPIVGRITGQQERDIYIQVAGKEPRQIGRSFGCSETLMAAGISDDNVASIHSRTIAGKPAWLVMLHRDEG